MADYYDVLGVAADASADEIKKAFRGLARQYHPDATGNDPEGAERYKQISEAYSVLSDPARRRDYDGQRLGVGGAGGFGSTIEDIFETFFGGGVRTRGRPTRMRQGESIEVELHLGFPEAVFGAKREVSFNRFERCARCGGNGCEPGSFPSRCDRCEGTGELQQVRRSVLGSIVTSHPCVACEGTGEMIPSPCRDCHGAGRVPEEATLTIEIPPGIDDGDRMRLSGEGGAGRGGGPQGDLYVRFSVQQDDRFVRSGDDLVTWVEVPMTTAALGGQVSFESLEGEESVAIPSGTQSGSLFRIRGKGQPHRRGRGRGDLIVRAHVVTPTGLDAEQERILKRLAEIRGESGEGKGIFAKLRRALGLEE